jgi:hypothetical protein
VAGQRLESDILDRQVVLWPGLSGLGKNKDKDGLEQTEKTTIKTKINTQ